MESRLYVGGLGDIYKNLEKLDIKNNDLDSIISSTFFKDFNEVMWKSPVCKLLCGLC